MVSERKIEHLDIAMSDRSQSGVSAGWDDIALVPATMPIINRDEVDLQTDLAGCRLAAPLVISSMTGGHEAVMEINRLLASAAQTLGLAVGSGSQRAALRDPSLVPTYRVLREAAPDAVIMANIGASQLVPQKGEAPLDKTDIAAVVAMVDAQLLAIHLNALEELVQPEGDDNLTGWLDAIAAAVEWSPVPVIVKETGSGVAREAIEALAGVGVAAVDVGGAGGTSFARVEGARAARRGDGLRSRLGTTFADWGIPTAASVMEGRSAGLPLIATGGIRSGLDAAKALALGASAVGIARPALLAASHGADALHDLLDALLEELRVAVVLSGAANLGQLRHTAVVISGPTGEWARHRGLI